MKGKRKVIRVDLVPLIVRITLGIVFIYHGYGKIFAGGHEHITALMADKGAPLPWLLGWMAGLTEFGGGILILAGFLSRVWALGLVILMLVAIGTVHWANGFSIQNHGYEYCLTLLLISFSILIAGPGRYSLDHIIFSDFIHKTDRKTYVKKVGPWIISKH